MKPKHNENAKEKKPKSRRHRLSLLSHASDSGSIRNLPTKLIVFRASEQIVFGASEQIVFGVSEQMFEASEHIVFGASKRIVFRASTYVSPPSHERAFKNLLKIH